MTRISRITAPRATLLAFLMLTAAMLCLGSLASRGDDAYPPVATATGPVEWHGGGDGQQGRRCTAGVGRTR